ncbi:cation transporter [uncultured Stenotrophomonas sp.]|uniref:cation transporter n=1 Tax=uncultured Stenotrophomonas sp. TaxID=165438 RepID=UPI0025D04140|nr:cation transporter [uncultured Stenotrophomonas sp.]
MEVREAASRARSIEGRDRKRFTKDHCRSKNGGGPSSAGLGIFGAVALVANLSCLALLWRFRKLNINMKSTFECSRNDVAANLGVLVAAGGVALTGQGWPDVLAGVVIGLLFLRSAISVIAEAWPAWKASRTP